MEVEKELTLILKYILNRSIYNMNVKNSELEIILILCQKLGGKTFKVFPPSFFSSNFVIILLGSIINVEVAIKIITSTFPLF